MAPPSDYSYLDESGKALDDPHGNGMDAADDYPYGPGQTRGLQPRMPAHKSGRAPGHLQPDPSADQPYDQLPPSIVAVEPSWAAQFPPTDHSSGYDDAAARARYDAPEDRHRPRFSPHENAPRIPHREHWGQDDKYGGPRDFGEDSAFSSLTRDPSGASREPITITFGSTADPVKVYLDGSGDPARRSRHINKRTRNGGYPELNAESGSESDIPPSSQRLSPEDYQMSERGWNQSSTRGTKKSRSRQAASPESELRRSFSAESLLGGRYRGAVTELNDDWAFVDQEDAPITWQT